MTQKPKDLLKRPVHSWTQPEAAEISEVLLGSLSAEGHFLGPLPAGAHLFTTWSFLHLVTIHHKLQVPCNDQLACAHFLIKLGSLVVPFHTFSILVSTLTGLFCC